MSSVDKSLVARYQKNTAICLTGHPVFTIRNLFCGEEDVVLDLYVDLGGVEVDVVPALDPPQNLRSWGSIHNHTDLVI